MPSDCLRRVLVAEQPRGTQRHATRGVRHHRGLLLALAQRQGLEEPEGWHPCNQVLRVEFPRVR